MRRPSNGIGKRQDGVGRFRERRVIIEFGNGCRFGDITNVNHPETGMPDRRPHFIADPERVMESVFIAIPGRFLATGQMLTWYVPTRDTSVGLDGSLTS